ncbi:MAG: FAD-dependent monooxygenase [Nitrospirae bacterium]|nr:FAD-dependent monooxygenase [Nitrospirota bacterium]
MGHLELSLKLPTDYAPEELRRKIREELGINEFTYTVLNKSLDARKKSNIHWLLRVSVISVEIKGAAPEGQPALHIPHGMRGDTAVVVGSGPAGFFSAFVLQKAGIRTTLIERGSEVHARAADIKRFEKTGEFSPKNNYAFGEGGAGTFSDGKLTSRTKNISLQRQFVLQSYIEAGAPQEIAYMAHPHLGSDNLRKIVKRLREEFISIGGSILFDTLLEDLKVENGKVSEAVTSSGGIGADHFVIATGHSAHDTYRMLIRRGVGFRTKNFAIGCRLEHEQEIINRAQWGVEHLPGVKAAEYRLTSTAGGNLPVYTFCMCPGGTIVPSAAFGNTNIVNGMSLYDRAGRFANAACVAGINPASFFGKEVTPLQALEWLSALEEKFYAFSGGFRAPFCGIRNFMDKKEQAVTAESSYPLGLKPAALWDLLPPEVGISIREGLRDFSKKIRGFDTGNIIGLESKTSSPVQVIKDSNNLCAGFENLYMVGEGSGYSGGIISSAVNGIKAAMSIIECD